MKKITHLIISLILIIYVNACTGYKPIFSSSNLQFKIADHLIKGDKKLGNEIYSKLYNLSNSNNQEAQTIHISIEVLKNKIASVKNSAGKILEYKISLNSSVVVKDYFTSDEMLSHNFEFFSSYKVQDQHSETLKLENKTIENLTNKTYQDLLIKLSETLSTE